MENKRSKRLSVLILVILFLIGVIIWMIFTKIDKAGLNETIAETIAFSKVRIQEYEDYTANDRVKSLIRLLDKSVELSSNIKKQKPYGQQELDD